MAASLAINGVNLESLGCYLEDPSPGLLSAPTRTIARVPVLGSMRTIAVGTPTYDRSIEFRGIIRPAANVTADRAAAEDALKALCRGTVRVTWTQDSAVRTIVATVKKLAIVTRGQQHPLLSVASEWTLALDCEDAVWVDADPTIRHCPTANVLYDCPVGGAPSRPIIEIMGGATNPAVHVCDAAGNLVWQFRFATTLTTAQSLELDRTTGRIWHWSSGARTDGIGYLNTADRAAWAQLTLDPQHGAIGYGPQVRVTAGRMRVAWWKAWP